MQVSYTPPPNYAAIIAAIPHVRFKRDVFFTYGHTVHVVGTATLSDSLLEHERIHCARQGKAPDLWWDKYLADPRFRLQEEIPAHVAEYEQVLKSGNRHERRAALDYISARLCGPLYGKLLTQRAAKDLLTA